MQKEKYSQELNRLLDYVEKRVVTEYPTMKINVNYLMFAILEQCNSFIYTIMKENMMESKIEVLYNFFSQLLDQKALKAVKPNRVITPDKLFENILKKAEEEMEELGGTKVTSVHVVLAIMKDESEDNKARDLLRKAGLSYEVIKQAMNDGNDDNDNEGDSGAGEDKPKGKSKREISRELAAAYSGIGFDYGSEGGSSIRDYCVDISKLAENGKIEKLIGRRNELSCLERVLGRRTKKNALLVGEGGCGKTTIAQNIAYLIDSGEVPPFLRNKRIVSLDYTSLISGTMYRGMLEERTRNLINDLKRNKNYILLIDDIDRIFGSRGGSEDFGIAAMLSHAMEDGSIQVMGTCSFKGYRNVFEKDGSLERKFQKIIINPNTKEESLAILRGTISNFEEYHKVKFDDTAIVAAVDLAEKYNNDRTLPDSAIDLIDETAAANSIMMTDGRWGEVRKKLRNVGKQIAKLKKEDKFDEADELLKTEQALKGVLAEIEKSYTNTKEYTPITVEDVMLTTSIRTGIPITKLTVNEKERLFSMAGRIKSEVIGQDNAVDIICRAIKRNRVGLRNDRNYGTFLLIGKSGCGKTLMAKKLAKEVFGDESNLIRFDMSEFSDKSSVSKLIGSNPGYIGYEEGGRLTEAVKNKKYCVLLLDEIEKADKDVYNIFLQVFDEGFLTDNSGRKVDFKNTIILMTSNVGVREASNFGGAMGFVDNSADNSKRIMTNELKKTFPPEFINRIDNIIYFNSLTEDNYRTIIELELRKMRLKAQRTGLDVIWDDDVVEYVFNLVRKEREFGARPIIRIIQDEFEDRIADILLEGDIQNDNKSDFQTYKIEVKKTQTNDTEFAFTNPRLVRV